MKRKTKISTNKTVRYLREVSIVVIGVAITLSLTLWINRKTEKRDIKLYLNAVIIELKENMKEIDNAEKYIRREINYTNYLQSDYKKNQNVDSLVYYAGTCSFSVKRFQFKSNAFEMFKSSGLMRLLNDRELMLTLWETYDNLSRLENDLDWLADYKWEIMKTEIPRIGDGSVDSEDLIDSPIMYNFYIFDSNTGSMISIENNKNFTKEAIDKLEKY